MPRRQELPTPPQSTTTTLGTLSGNAVIDPATSPEPADIPNPGMYLARVLRADQGVLTAAVLLPNTTDLKGTAYTPETIREAMDGFTQSPHIGIEHKGKPLTSGVTHLASWQTQEDGDFDGNALPSGTWMMTLLITDPDLWQKVESGEINGLSIQGTAHMQNSDFDNQGASQEGSGLRESVLLVIEAILYESSKYRYSSTQVDLEYGLRDKVLEFGRALIPDEDLHDAGREFEPHVTVKYGLHTSKVDPVRNQLEGEKGVRGELGQTDIFEAPDYDVVHLKVHSPDLHRLNRSLSTLPHTDTHPDYHPHITLAYVKKGTGHKYRGLADLEGQPFESHQITFSSRTGNRDYIFMNHPEYSSLT